MKFDKAFDELVEKIKKKKKWSAKIKTKWDPPEGLFTKSAEEIASVLKKESNDLQTAMGRLNYYINRAGKNLSADEKKRLENAKNKLRKKMA